jgi:hypothetical protein
VAAVVVVTTQEVHLGMVDKVEAAVVHVRTRWQLVVRMGGQKVWTECCVMEEEDLVVQVVKALDLVAVELEVVLVVEEVVMVDLELLCLNMKLLVLTTEILLVQLEEIFTIPPVKRFMCSDHLGH